MERVSQKQVEKTGGIEYTQKQEENIIRNRVNKIT